MDRINYALEGLVFDIQRFSVNDGPGIRTIVFLNGCPLRCEWCSNPESQLLRPVVMFNELECIHCKACLSVCKQGAISPENKALIDYSKCVGCGECSLVCPVDALVMKGRKMTIEQVVKELKKDGTNYRRSGGGLTISGGEPLMQHEFTKELLKAAHAQGWNTAIETTACASEEVIRDVLPHVDLALADVKNMDAQVHKQYTGVSNEQILSGIQLISQITNICVRVPVIPGFNDKKEDIKRIAQFAKTLNQEHLKGVNLLPYHSLGENKYKMLGRDYLLHGVKMIEKEDISVLKDVVEQSGVNCRIG
ncbi:glycyl-radical enzyme activating protein [Eubacterium oxidoreducens]|uniref:Pyruvate formate lyase activating enzyme n=1 Tax=Eubacterium oxidoreducens TaxID=1732 RepID=A0A1G6BR89_EUBOX|nr:glycyl-radical enzyme activating protein [Eubacterium oxidoreducens]SDB23087.1 pyruvate formate lyase activating enzyme [Eubacterium oxidoreducens]